MKTPFSHKMTAFLAATLAIAAPAVAATGETKQVTVAGEQVAEIMPGMLEGYLTKEEQLDSKAFVLPAPEKESARQAMDSAVAAELHKMQEGPRWDLARMFHKSACRDMRRPVRGDVGG